MTRDYPNDTALYEAFRHGSPQAATVLFQTWVQPLCYFAERHTHNRQEAEDIVAETFIKLLQRRDRFENLANIRAFLFAATRNACINYVQETRRHQQIHARIRHLNLPGDEDNADPLEEETIRLQVLTDIYLEIEELPGKCRDIFKFIFLEGLSTDQIAERMGIATQTVRTQKARALQLLRSQLLRKGKVLAWGCLLATLAPHS